MALDLDMDWDVGTDEGGERLLNYSAQAHTDPGGRHGPPVAPRAWVAQRGPAVGGLRPLLGRVLEVTQGAGERERGGGERGSGTQKFVDQK